MKQLTFPHHFLYSIYLETIQNTNFMPLFVAESALFPPVLAYSYLTCTLGCMGFATVNHGINPTWPCVETHSQKQCKNLPHILFGSHCIANHGCWAFGDGFLSF